MKTASLFALTGLALTSSLMADQPLPKIEAVEIKPEIAICRMPAPTSLVKEMKDMEANEDAIQSILQNKEAKNAIDKLNKPIVLNSMEDALKHLTRASMEKINVDFDKQQLVIFAWQGSGQDRLHGFLHGGKGAVANFNYNEGMTEDLRTHSVVYSMPKGTELKVHKQPRIIRCGVGMKHIEPKLVPQDPGCDLQVIPMPEGGKIELKIQPNIQPLQQRGE